MDLRPNSLRFRLARAACPCAALFWAAAFPSGLGRAWAQSFSIEWSSIMAGGGTSSGGAFDLEGAVAAPAADLSEGGAYSLQSGPWAVLEALGFAVPPSLSIALAPSGEAMVSWSPAAPGFVLQESLSLSPASWSDSPTGASNPAMIQPGSAARFFRLFKP